QSRVARQTGSVRRTWQARRTATTIFQDKKIKEEAREARGLRVSWRRQHVPDRRPPRHSRRARSHESGASPAPWPRQCAVPSSFRLVTPFRVRQFRAGSGRLTGLAAFAAASTRRRRSFSRRKISARIKRRTIGRGALVAPTRTPLLLTRPGRTRRRNSN